MASHMLPLQGQELNGKPPVVGFCFSFAVEQTALNEGKLMGWTKGFDVKGVVGKDVVKLLSGGAKRGEALVGGRTVVPGGHLS